MGKSGQCPSCQRVVRLVGPDFRAGTDRFWASLLCISGPRRAGDQWFVGGPGPIEIGKLPGRHIRLIGTQVSRSHCRLIQGDDGWWIEDQGSKNGLFVNDKRVEQRLLHDGDLIRIGDFDFKYLISEDAPATAGLEDGGVDATDETAESASVAQAEEDDEFDADNLYRLAEEEETQPAVEIERAAPPPQPETAPPPTGGPACPSCKKPLPARAKICVNCGINLATGRAIITTQDESLDRIYVTVEGLVRWISWVFWIGLHPIASEAFGTSKPYVLRAIAIITVITSTWFIYIMYSGQAEAHQELMLWCGELPEGFTAEELELGSYREGQLITHAFLHGGIMHLVGNMIFMLVFGSRVNAMIGNIGTFLLYPVLAISAALFEMAASAHEPRHAMLGASGAVMGLAGMYLVLFPVHKVHMVFWYRLGLLWGFRLSYKIFAVRGFWVVLFCIASDVLYVSLGIDDKVAHWAHLGGFISGMVVGILLLTCRLINGRGGDLLSVLFGKRAWLLIGKPRA